MNSLSPPFKQDLVNFSITDFSLICEIFKYRLKKLNLNIEAALYREFDLFITLITIWLFLTDQNVLTPQFIGFSIYRFLFAAILAVMQLQQFSKVNILKTQMRQL